MNNEASPIPGEWINPPAEEVGAEGSSVEVVDTRDMSRFLESPQIKSSIDVVNSLLVGLREKGQYGGADISIDNLEVVRFPDMPYAHGASSPKEVKVTLLPSSVHSPSTIVHELLHLASNWRFTEQNNMEREQVLRSGFLLGKALYGAEDVGILPDEWKHVNEGFTEFFTQKYTKNMSDTRPEHKQEMSLLCSLQFDEKLALMRSRLDVLERKPDKSDLDLHLISLEKRYIEAVENDKSAMLAAMDPFESYGNEVSFAGTYIFAKTMKRYKAKNEEDLRAVRDFEKEITEEALVAYINGDTKFFDDMDSIFGEGAHEEFKRVGSSRDFFKLMLKYGSGF